MREEFPIRLGFIVELSALLNTLAIAKGFSSRESHLPDGSYAQLAGRYRPVCKETWNCYRGSGGFLRYGPKQAKLRHNALHEETEQDIWLQATLGKWAAP